MKLAFVRPLLLRSVFLLAVLLGGCTGRPAEIAVADVGIAPASGPKGSQLDRPTPRPTANPTAKPTATLTASPTAEPTAEPTATARPASPVTIADTYYYRYQGSSDSGACKTANCGPAVFAAAIGYAKDDWIAITDVRTYISGKSCRGTDYNDAYRALDHWGVDYKTTSTMKELKAAVSTRSHPVLVILNMDNIGAGTDYLKPATDPAQHFGRFHDYTYGHFVVVKGFSEDGKWVIIDDPYVFDGKAWGFYKGGEAKGHNRYVKYAEFDKAFRYFGYQGIEIIPN